MHKDHRDLSKCMTRFLWWYSFCVKNDWLLALSLSLSLSLSQVNLKNKNNSAVLMVTSSKTEKPVTSSYT
jgi:hypothetical protein